MFIKFTKYYLFILPTRVDKNECGDILVEDLLSFFDASAGLSKPVVPFSHGYEFSELSRIKDDHDYSWISCDCFLEKLALEKELGVDEKAEAAKDSSELHNE